MRLRQACLLLFVGRFTYCDFHNHCILTTVYLLFSCDCKNKPVFFSSEQPTDFYNGDTSVLWKVWAEFLNILYLQMANDITSYRLLESHK
jgi:hypothetical protein